MTKQDNGWRERFKKLKALHDLLLTDNCFACGTNYEKLGVLFEKEITLARKEGAIEAYNAIIDDFSLGGADRALIRKKLKQLRDEQ